MVAVQAGAAAKVAKEEAHPSQVLDQRKAVSVEAKEEDSQEAEDESDLFYTKLKL